MATHSCFICANCPVRHCSICKPCFTERRKSNSVTQVTITGESVTIKGKRRERGTSLQARIFTQLVNLVESIEGKRSFQTELAKARLIIKEKKEKKKNGTDNIS